MHARTRSKLSVLLAIAALLALALAAPQSASAKPVVLEPCFTGSVYGFGTWSGVGGSYPQWTLEARCPSQLTMYANPGVTLGTVGAYFGFPYNGFPVSHGTITKVEMDFSGGNGTDAGLSQGFRVCKQGATECGSLATPSGTDLTAPEHHEMTPDNGEVPANSDMLYFIGGCPLTPAHPCSPGRPLIVSNLKITIEDDDPPTLEPSEGAPYDDLAYPPPPITFPINYTGWNTGTKGLRVRAQDEGIGVKYIEYEIHRDGLDLGPHWNELAPNCGDAGFLPHVPYVCANDVESEHLVALNQGFIGNYLGEGLNHATIYAYDAAGNRSNPVKLDYLVDTVRPKVCDLTATPYRASEWRPASIIGLSWKNCGENLPTDTQSGVRTAKYTATPESGNTASAVTGTVQQVGVESIPSLNPLGPGRWLISLTTTDAAPNTSTAVTLRVSIDSTVLQKPALKPLPVLSGNDVKNGPDLEWTPPANKSAAISGICHYAISVDQSENSDPGAIKGVEPTATSTELPKYLPNGLNYVHIRAVSCSGVEGEVAHMPVTVDSDAPELDVSAPGPDGWYSAKNPFKVTVHGDPEPNIKISVAIDGAPDLFTATTTKQVNLSAGAHTAILKVRDEIGNESMRVLTVKADPDGPSSKFAVFDKADPTLVRATVSDSRSGLRNAYLQYREAGEVSWKPLGVGLNPETASTAPSQLTATFPDEMLPDGEYELRAVAYDIAGNSSFSSERVDGSQARLTLPLRAGAVVSAGFAPEVATRRCSGKGKKRKCRIVARADSSVEVADSVSLAYGHSAKLTGSLHDAGGDAIAGGKLQIVEAVVGKPRRMVEVLSSDADGRFAYKAPAGPSRRLTVRFLGSAVNSPAEDVATIYVAAKVKLTIKRSRVQGGWRVDFAGHVYSDGATIPKTGKPVKIRFRAADSWQSFPDEIVADQDGDFKYARAFKSAKHPVVYEFVAKVPGALGWPYESGASPVVKVVLR